VEKLSKSHLIDKFLDFNFDDNIEVLLQVKVLEKFVMKLKDEKITLCNTFISSAIVNRFPPSLMSFSNDNRRRKKHVPLSDLKRSTRNENEIKIPEKNELLAKQKVSANIAASKSNKDVYQGEEVQ